MRFVCKPHTLKKGERKFRKRVVRRILSRVRRKRRGKWKGKKNANVKKEGEKTICQHCSKDGHDEAHCWKLHPELRPKKQNNKGKQNMTATTQHDLGSNYGDETKISAMVTKGKEVIASTSSSHSQNDTTNEEPRIELFHVSVISNHTEIDALFNSQSQSNLIS